MDIKTKIEYVDAGGEKCSMLITSDADGRGMIQLFRGCRVKSETRRCFRDRAERETLLRVLLKEQDGNGGGAGY